MKEKKSNIFKTILIAFFIVYLGLYIAGTNGYYENAVKKKALYTQSQIEQFESDIKNNVELDQMDYFQNEKDYSNFLTLGANNLLNFLRDILDNKLSRFWKFIKSLFVG